MGTDKRELTYEELVSILERSMVVQDRQKSKSFSRDDIVRAAEELGVDPEVASEVVDAHLRHRGASSPALVPRPFDTRVRLAVAPDVFIVTIPPMHFSVHQLGPLGFLAAWFTFIGIWTGHAIRAGTWSVIFSAPFWLAGVAMTLAVLMPVLRTTVLHIDRERATIRKRPGGAVQTLRTSEIGVRVGHRVRFGHEDVVGGKALLIDHGVRTYPLLEGYSEREQKWIESELKSWLASQ